jgi:hypothetical protein
VSSWVSYGIRDLNRFPHHHHHTSMYEGFFFILLYFLILYEVVSFCFICGRGSGCRDVNPLIGLQEFPLSKRNRPASGGS